MDKDFIEELVGGLEMLVSDSPLRVREELEKVIQELKNVSNNNDLLKIQDELERISNMPNIDSFSRNVIMDAITSIERIVNF